MADAHHRTPTRRSPDLARAHEAFALGEWGEAARLFREHDQRDLTGEDLETYADAIWWLSDIDDAITKRTKAYNAYLTEGDKPRAAYTAWFLAYDFFLKNEVALGSGWIEHARRLLASEPACEQHGYLILHDAWMALEAGDLDAAERLGEQALSHAERYDSDGLTSLGLETIGRAKIARGEIEQGCRLLDESMTAVIAGRLSPLFTGWVYCNVLTACIKIADLRRAGEWTRAALTWCGSLDGTTPYHGLCRIYRVELTTMLGEWEDAEAQASQAIEDLLSVSPPVAAGAFYAAGEIHRLRGEHDRAEDAYARAHELGHEPQPGLALLRLAQNKIDAARAGLRLPLAGPQVSTLSRARLLEAAVEVSIAADDLDAARDATAQLGRIAEVTKGDVFAAISLSAEARLSLAAGDADDAALAAQAAVERWHRMRLPYDTARARTVLAQACRHTGDDDRARMELEAARAAFTELGAAREAARIDELLGARTGALSGREQQVLRLVAGGMTNKQIAAELTISEHTVSRHLQNIFAKLDVGTRAAATAWAFEHDLV